MQRLINFLAHSTFLLLHAVGWAIAYAGFELWMQSVRPDVSFNLELVLGISSVACIGIGSLIALFSFDEWAIYSNNQNR